MKSIKHFILPIFILFCLPSIGFTQSDDNPKKEIGVSIHGLNNYGLIYKVQRKNGSYLRIDGTAANLGIGNNFSAFNLNLSTRITNEKRKDLGEKTFMNYGIGVGLSGSLALASDNRTAINVLPSIHYLLGVQYKILEKGYIGLEIAPSIGTRLSYNSPGNNFAYGVNLSANTSARLVFMYEL